MLQWFSSFHYQAIIEGSYLWGCGMKERALWFSEIICFFSSFVHNLLRLLLQKNGIGETHLHGFSILPGINSRM
jgi:hypothetical protein